MRKITGAFRKNAWAIVALVFFQALIGINFNFLAQIGDVSKNSFQDILVGVLSGSIRGYHPIDQSVLQSKFMDHYSLHILSSW